MELQQIQESVFDSFEIDAQHLPEATNEEEKFRAFRELLIRRIDELIHHDFDKLKGILYRIDVNERKLREALEKSEADAATVISDLIIERQIEKAASRKQHGEQSGDWSFDV